MTKNDYLNSLRRELSGFSKEELEDVIRDQDEYITDAVASGRQEDEVIKSLGYSSSLARELKASHHLKSAEGDGGLLSKTGNVMNAVIALCVLAPFNLIFVLGPFIAVCSIIATMWTLALAGVITGLALVVASFATIAAGAAMFVGSFFGSWGVVGASVLFIFGCYIMTSGFLQMTIWYLRKNLEFVQGK